MKWSWAGYINGLKYDRRASRVTTWRPYDKKRRQVRPAKRSRDDLNKYWSDTIWQRTAQYRLTWRRHAEAESFSFLIAPHTTSTEIHLFMNYTYCIIILYSLHSALSTNNTLSMRFPSVKIISHLMLGSSPYDLSKERRTTLHH